MNKEQENELVSEIARKREEWAALSPEEKVEHLRQVQEEGAKREEERDRVTQGKLNTILDGFKTLADGVKVMTPEQEREFFFRDRVVPQMRSLGWPDRHIRRIAPHWGAQWKDQEDAFHLARAFLHGKGAIVPLVGARGTGKTTIAAQISILRCIENLSWWYTDPADRFEGEPTEPGRYVKLGKLSAMFKPLYADFGSINTEALQQRMEAWVKAPLVVLDEIHEAEDLRTQMRFLTDLLDRRYASRRDTIIISNHDPERFAADINPSIMSRIGEHAAVIPCLWGSHRVK